jgi:hypothetical protein
MAAVVETDKRASAALGTALARSGRPLVVTSGTLGLTPGHLATEEDLHDPGRPSRGPSEEAALAMVSRGVRASVVRLPPSVHGDGDHGFVPQLMGIARKKGVSSECPTIRPEPSARVIKAAALVKC